jgi:hypothetical protein
MSPSSLRVLAGAAAAVFALLTAIAVGLVSRPAPCVPNPTVPASSAPVTTAPPAPSPSASHSNSLGNAVGEGLPNPERSERQAPPPPATTTSAPTRNPTQTSAEGGNCDGADRPLLAAGPALTALVGAGLTGAAILALLLLATRPRPDRQSAPAGHPARLVPPPPQATPPRSAPQGPWRPGGGAESTGPGDAAALADRAALVRVCIYVRDRVTSRALADRLANALNDAGVRTVEPVGERFDPARHEAGGATHTPDPKLVGTIAAVEVAGYIDRGGRVLRPPIVTVYQAGSGRPAAPRTAEEDR